MTTQGPSTTMRHSIACLAAVTSALLILSGCSMRGGGTTASDAPNSELTADCVDYQPTQGVTDDTVKVGTSLPVTGALATAGLGRFGMEAYFDYVNETEGGVHGRELELIVRDDAYDPAKTTVNVNELLNNEGVFAMLNILGTANVLATEQDLQDACVPNLMVGTGSPLVSTPEQTWTVPGQPSYTVEANVLAQAAIDAGVQTVAIISQNDDFGKAYVASLTETLEGAGVEVVEQVTYDVGVPTVDTEVSTLAASKADAAFVAALGTKCPQIINGIKASSWEPLLMAGTLCTSKALLGLLENGAGNGMLSTAWYKSPGDAQWADDPALAVYREAVAKYTPEADPNEDFVLTGWLWAQLFVEVLKSADSLDRAAVMEAARNADYHVDTMLDGVQFETSPTRFDPVTTLQVVRYDNAEGNLQFIDPATGDALPDGTTSLTTAGDSK